jgi:NADH:ubiquinone oxidoreductase subunit 2 (chain N)
MALILALLLFSMAGIPPLAGFFAKFAVFIAALDGGMIIVAVLAILASVVGSFYYLRLVVGMYMQEPQEDVTIAQPIILAGVGALLVSLFVFAPWILIDSVEAVAKIAP